MEYLVKGQMNMGMQFEEKSRLIMTGEGTMTAGQAAQAGAASAYAVQKKSIFVGHSGERGAAALAAAFASGALSAGSDVINGGVCAPSAAAYAASQLGCGLCCFAHTEITSSLRFCDGKGMTLFRDAEDTILSSAGHVHMLPYSHFGRYEVFDGADGLYAAKIRGIFGGRLEGIFADICSSSENVIRLCGRILEDVNDLNGKRIAVHINSGCDRISAYTEETGYVSSEKLELICCRDRLNRGEDIAVCGMPSRTLEKMAAAYGRKVFSCGRHSCTDGSHPSEDCLKARELASKQLFMHDGTALAMEVLEILRRRGIGLTKAVSELPPMTILNRYIPAEHPSELLRRLCSERMGADGILSDGKAGRVTVRPVRTGKGIMLSVESYAMETAEELCGFYQGVINSGRNDVI